MDAFEKGREAKFRADSKKYLKRTGRPLSRKTFEACNPRSIRYTVEDVAMMNSTTPSELNESTLSSAADKTAVHHPIDQPDEDDYFQDDNSDAGSLAGSDDFSRMMILDAGEEQSRQPHSRHYSYSYSADDDRRWREYERGNPNAFSAPLPPSHPLRGRRFGSISSNDSEPINERLGLPAVVREGATLFAKKLRPRPSGNSIAILSSIQTRNGSCLKKTFDPAKRRKTLHNFHKSPTETQGLRRNQSILRPSSKLQSLRRRQRRGSNHPPSVSKSPSGLLQSFNQAHP